MAVCLWVYPLKHVYHLLTVAHELPVVAFISAKGLQRAAAHDVMAAAAAAAAAAASWSCWKQKQKETVRRPMHRPIVLTL